MSLRQRVLYWLHAMDCREADDLAGRAYFQGFKDGKRDAAELIVTMYGDDTADRVSHMLNDILIGLQRRDAWARSKVYFPES